MKRAGIPSPPPGDAALQQILTAMKENIELLTGVRGAKLTAVPSTAALSDVITALNKVISRLS